MDDSVVFINDEKIGNTILGYFRYTTDSGEHSIKLTSTTAQGLWSYEGTKEVIVSGGEVSSVMLKIKQSKAPTNRQALLKKSTRVLFDPHSSLYFLDDLNTRLDTIHNAKEYCKQLTIEGVSNWRVTTQNELEIAFSLMKKFKDFNEVPNQDRQWYGSSTEVTPNRFFAINFEYGHRSSEMLPKYSNKYRCVL